MANRTRSKKRNKNKRSKKQRGGAEFNPDQRQQLLGMGFTEDHIQTLEQLFLDNMSAGAAINLIQQSLGQINNDTGLPNTPQEIIDSLNPDNDGNISQIGSENGSDVNNVSVGSFAFENENDLSNIDDGNNSEHNISDDSFVFDQEDLDNNLNDNINDISDDSIIQPYDEGNTTSEDSSFMDIAELNVEDDNQYAGKRRKTRKIRKTRKTKKIRKGKKSRKTKKQRGGMRYGTGVGANCFDPNYSIYNTPALTLFPYKPN